MPQWAARSSARAFTASGTPRWQDLGRYPGLDVVPTLAAAGTLWASAETSYRFPLTSVHGRLRETRPDDSTATREHAETT